MHWSEERFCNARGKQVSARDQDSWTPLHFAARFHGDENEIINELLEKGADVNVKVYLCLINRRLGGEGRSS